MNADQRNVNRLAGLLTFLIVLMGLTVVAQARDDRADQNAPLVALLTPRDGAALNAPTLRVQALVAAFKPDLARSFVFNGQAVAGRNAGRVSLVEIAVDGLIVDRVEHHACRRQMVADARVDISGLANGPHTLTVTAFQGDPRGGLGRSVTATFRLDRSLPVAERNRIEEAATPAPFACLALRAEDFDDDDDAAGRRHLPPLELEGRIVPSHASDGLDPARDRVVIAVGSRVTVFEPGALTCTHEKCRFEDRRHPVVQRVELEHKGDGSWEIQLRGDPLPSESSTVYLRIGNDWGGIDLATGERLAALRPVLDTAHQARATIGAAGGTIQTTDAHGVVIGLDIPAGALTQDTLIKVTPLSASPVPDSSNALFPGVKFEPEGLQFAQPATLTLAFSATGKVITNHDFVFLLTSPLTALPLFGQVNSAAKTMTAQLNHFSTIQPGVLGAALTDLAAWADPILSGTGNATFSELASLAALAALQQQRGCTRNCINLNQLTQRARASFAALVSATCSSSTANPTDQALERLLQLETVGQALGVDTIALRTCEEQVFRALIIDYGARALVNPSDTNLARLLNSAVRAQQLGFDNLDILALQKLAAALRALLNQGQQACRTDATTGRALLNRALPYAQAVAAFGVDTALANDLQQAINNCGGGAGAVTFTISRVSIAAFSGDLVPPGASSKLPPGAVPLPFSVSLSRGLANLNVNITQSGNTLAVDATGAAGSKVGTNVFGFLQEYTSDAECFFDLAVDIPTIGFLTVEVNREWGTPATIAGVPVGLARVDVPGVGSVHYPIPPGISTVFQVGLGGNPFQPGPSQAIGIVRIILATFQLSDTPTTGRGRVLTITFTPVP